MPVATNSQTGESVYLDDAGAWVPAQTAKNPQTGEELIFDGKGWQPKAAPAAPTNAKSMLNAVQRGAEQGATFGFSDELKGMAAASGVPMAGGPLGMIARPIVGAARYAMGDQGAVDAYNQTVQGERANIAQANQQHPYLSAGAELAGAVGSAAATLPAGLAGGAARGLPALGRYIGIGAAQGGLQGAGTATGGVTDRLPAAGTGAVVGGAVGAALPYAVSGVSRMAQGVRNAFSPESNVAADLGRALLRDQDTPQALAQRAAQLAADRPGVATLADAGGENVKGLVERVAQTPGAGRTQVVPALTTRQQGQMTRLADDLGQLTGTHRTATQAIEQTIQSRATAAQPLYDQAFNFNARDVPELVHLWENATGSGWGKSILNGPDFRKTIQTEYGIRNPADAPLMVQIDAWKKQVDGLVGEAVRAGNGNRARVLGDMRDRVVEAVDHFNPAYGQARNAWAGPSKYMDAIEEGRNILSSRMGAEEMASRFGGMTAAEQEAFRIGAVSAIRGKMGSDAANLGDMTKYLRSPDVRAKILSIMPDQQSAEAWTRRLDFEVGTSQLTGRALGNSATARRLAERQDADNIMGDLVMSALGGMPVVSLWRQALTAIPNRIRDTMRSRADARLADVLVNPANNTPAAVANLLAQANRAAAPVSTRTQAGVLGGSNALLTGP